MKQIFLAFLRKGLLTICKAFVKPNLDYAEIIYDKPLNWSFKRKIEVNEHNAAIIVAGAIKVTSFDKLNQELSLKSCRLEVVSKAFLSWNNARTITILTPKISSFLSRLKNLIFKSKENKNLFARTKSFETSFFPHCSKEWRKASEEMAKYKFN